MHTYIPEGYAPILDLYQTQTAIGDLKQSFQRELATALNLKRATAPLFVDPASGLNDNLNGVERPVSFDIKGVDTVAEVVQSLAKWKRMALMRYGFAPGEGIYTDMNAIRRDEDLDNLHSVYTDQWDWEKVITREQRNIETLKNTVRAIVAAVSYTNDAIKAKFPQLSCRIERDVFFVTAQELEDMYPELSPKERENKIVREHGTVFVMQIGKLLRSGTRHDGRAPDYDDWELNGDILVWNDVIDCAFELSSMGIRVDAESLDRQLSELGADDRRSLTYHRMLLADELPLTIGGGIGQSRLCMLILQKAHIGEVQVSVWDSETVEACERGGIPLL
ncbi:MAG: aspartate--ammonia ligase [Oscillospiraceae bacterium]|nr:MAG: aspartate--ammonia ligase [Oscillospiraceae bacterium]